MEISYAISRTENVINLGFIKFIQNYPENKLEFFIDLAILSSKNFIYEVNYIISFVWSQMNVILS
jgi:hypothetical protein